MSCSDLASIHNEPPGPVRFEARNNLLGELGDAAGDRLLDGAGAQGDDGYLVELRHLGAALGPAEHSRAVIGRRDANYILYTGTPLGTGPDGPSEEKAAAAQATLHRALESWAIGAVTPAFLSGPSVTQEQLRSAYHPADYHRLRQLKADWDPDNTFRVNQNLQPASTG